MSSSLGYSSRSVKTTSNVVCALAISISTDGTPMFLAQFQVENLNVYLICSRILLLISFRFVYLYVK